MAYGEFNGRAIPQKPLFWSSEMRKMIARLVCTLLLLAYSAEQTGFGQVIPAVPAPVDANYEAHPSEPMVITASSRSAANTSSTSIGSSLMNAGLSTSTTHRLHQFLLQAKDDLVQAEIGRAHV